MPHSKREPLPSKPHPKFPLFPHQTHRWAKKIKDHLRYFGSTDGDPEGKKALAKSKLALPTAVEDELIVTGCLFLSPRDVWPRVSAIVDRRMFFDEGLGKAFDVMGTLFEAGKPIDNARWLLRELPKHDVSNATNDQLSKIFREPPNYAHAVYHAEHARDAYRLRGLCVLSTELQGSR